MKRIACLVLWLVASFSVCAQYGNEWIRFNQQYFKIPIGKDGIYRLTYADLQAAGFPMGSDYRRIQLFHRGVEQAVRIQKANIGTTQLEPGDYLEFYGVKNNGDTDAELYQPAEAQPHKYYNLFSDTTSYFLTFNPLPELGKRIEEVFEQNVGGVIPKENYHTAEKLLVLNSEYSTGAKYNDYIQSSYFDAGEGWTGNKIALNQSIDYNFNELINTYTSSALPTLEVLCVGREDLSHQVEVSVGPSSPSRVVNTSFFSQFSSTLITANLNWSDIGTDGKLAVRIKALGVSGGADLFSASYIKVRVPQIFNASNADKLFELNPNGSDKSYIEIQNAPVNARIFDITDLSNVKLIGTTSTTTLNAVVPSTSTSRKLFLSSTFTTPPIKQVYFRNIIPSQHNFIIVSHSILMNPSSQYSDPVKAYGAYRKSLAGGGYDTLIVTVQQLYDQFTNGEVTPVAIKRFMKFMVENGAPKYLFFIGRGLDVNLNYHRNPSAFSTFKDLVPSYGMPASDALFTVGLNGTAIEPAVPTGRITATTPADVEAYLNKVKQMEALPFNELWRKEILHLSGGLTQYEPAIFQSYLQGFQAIAESYYLGSKVSAIAKNNTEIEFINISQKVNSGVNLVTLFGHSSPSGNDFNIGFVSAAELGYANAGKYPMFLLNGCNAGDFFYTEKRYGEDWINTPSKGAIGFMANTSFGFSNVLRLFSDTFYKVAYGDSVFINKGIGDVLKEVGRRFNEQGFTSIAYTTQSQQMFLLGDPSLKLFGALKPDYEINEGGVFEESFSQEPITALSDSFAIKIAIRNFGVAKEDSVWVNIRRELSDNSVVEYDSLFPSVLYKDTITFVIPRNEKGFGNNNFTITIDARNEINEINEDNNTVTRTIFIPLNSSKNLFPQNFSIVSSQTANLVIQSSDILGEARDFIIQVDTLDTFDSPFVQQFVVNGIIASQAVSLLSNDTLAYYWRSKFAQPKEGESNNWTLSSFTFINNSPEGWAQVHFPQFLADESTGLIKDSEARKLILKETVTNINIYTIGSANPEPYTSVSVKVNGTEFNPISLGNSCRNNTINLVAFEKTTTFPYISIPVQFPDNRACGRRPEIIASFSSAQVETGDKDLIQYINNVPAGDSIILFSIGNPGITSWSANVFTKLSEIGIASTQITSLQAGEPFIIYAKKGTPGGSALVIKSNGAPAAEQSLQSIGTITGRYTSGTLQSVTIGPAINWQQIKLRADVSELPQTDLFTFDVIGVSLLGDVDTLLTNVASEVDITSIDATDYPYLRLVYYATDEVNLTAPQLNRWVVIYTPAPEGVLAFHSSKDAQMLQEGQIWEGSYSFTNISSKTFSDSLIVRYELQSKAARGSNINYKKIKAPAPGEQTDFILSVPTIGKGGVNDFDVFVNPRIQPELYYDNNILQLNNYIQVSPDLFSPALDITFDGRHILNGDFVSQNPTIQMKVWDENPFLLKQDTTGIEIFLQYPCENPECFFQPIYFSRSDISWEPATSTSEFIINFNPANLVEGEYILRVNAKDVVGNLSDDEPYEVHFLVRSFSTLEIRNPFPNPSSQLVHFSALITGDQVPNLVSVQVISSNGSMVHEFYSTKFFVGTNEWVWDCSDASGNPVPAGLYIYKINLILNDKPIKSKQGKLMIIR